MSKADASPSSANVDGFNEKNPKPMVSKGWFQGIALVMLLGFTIMGILANGTYNNSMPVPQKVVTESGQTVFTNDQIMQGQQLFTARGLHEYGTIVGHGGYLGPDYTAEYLHLSTEYALDKYRASGVQDPTEAVAKEWRQNRYNPETGTLVWTDTQVEAFAELKKHYTDTLGTNSGKYALPANFITDPQEINDLTAFYGWTAWASAAERPDLGYSYTNNWPEEKNVNNTVTADVVVWSVLSLIVLIGGIGAMFAIYGRWSRKLGWEAEEAPVLNFRQPSEINLTPSQKNTALFFAVIMVLFLVQTLLGGLAEHYRVEMDGFFGIDLNQLLPFNLTRTWHLQLSLFWTAAGFLAAGIFITPFVAKKEPKGQGVLTAVLFVAVAIVVFGTLATTWFSINGNISEGTLFSQQWEYLDLPRLFQILLTVGMFVWIGIIWRGLRARLKGESKGNMPWLFFFAGLAIPAFYAVGMLASTGTQISVAEFWRFWVVHLWVEDFLELFTTVMVAYIFVLLGVVRERIALSIIVLDVILYSAGGVVGTAHHLYFSGTPVEAMSLGAFFSAAEVIPLTLLTVEAWAFMQLGARQHASRTKPFPHRWAVMFLVAVGFWNFLGAGVFGFLVNLPIVSYYEIGTALTANHAHAAMMGVYGMLAIGLAVFALRYIVPEKKWPERGIRYSFWALNIGLAWMVFVSLLPTGIMQLATSVSDGYYAARSLTFAEGSNVMLLEWLRLPGDVLFITGTIPLVWLGLLGLLNFYKGKRNYDLTDTPLYEKLTAEELARLDEEEAQLESVGAGNISTTQRASNFFLGTRYRSDRPDSSDRSTSADGSKDS